MNWSRNQKLNSKDMYRYTVRYMCIVMPLKYPCNSRCWTGRKRLTSCSETEPSFLFFSFYLYFTYHYWIWDPPSWFTLSRRRLSKYKNILYHTIAFWLCDVIRWPAPKLVRLQNRKSNSLSVERCCPSESERFKKCLPVGLWPYVVPSDVLCTWCRLKWQTGGW